MIPTMFGIMLVAFVVVQFAPGGPVEQVIAKLTGTDTGATARISGSAGGDFGGRGHGAGRRAGATPRRPNIAARRGSTPNSSRSWRSSSASTSRPMSASSSCCGTTSASISARAISATCSVLQLIKEKLPVSMSLGHLDDAAHLPDLDPARHPQGDRRRLALRHVDLDRDRHRLCHPRLPVRHPADRAVRRRLVLRHFPVARADLGEFLAQLPWSPRSSTISGT